MRRLLLAGLVAFTVLPAAAATAPANSGEERVVEVTASCCTRAVIALPSGIAASTDSVYSFCVLIHACTSGSLGFSSQR